MLWSNMYYNYIIFQKAVEYTLHEQTNDTSCSTF